MILASIIGPDWLKYGFLGFVALVNVMIYLMIQPVIKNEKNKKAWIITFLCVSLLLIAVGGIYNYSNDKMKNNNEHVLDSIKTVNMDLQRKLDIFGDSSGLELKSKIEKNAVSLDSLKKVNLSFEDSIKYQQNIISDLIIKSITEALETDLVATSGKGRLGIPDVNYKRLKRAVFLNLLNMHADPNILHQALTAYRKQSGEISENDINRIIQYLPDLMRIKLSWLKNEAIPKLQADIDSIKRTPQKQEIAEAQVKIPNEIWIMPNNNNGNIVIVNDMLLLKKEKELLINRLSF